MTVSGKTIRFGLAATASLKTSAKIRPMVAMRNFMEAFPAHSVLCETDLIPKWEHHETKKRFKRARNRLKLLAQFDAESARWHKCTIDRLEFATLVSAIHSGVHESDWRSPLGGHEQRLCPTQSPSQLLPILGNRVD